MSAMIHAEPTLSANDAPPALTPQAHFDTMLGRVWLLLQRFVARYGYRMFGSGESFSEAYAGFAQAMAMIQRDGQPEPVEPWHSGQWPSPDAIQARLDAQNARLAARLHATHSAAHDVYLPLEELRARFGLTDPELMILICAAAPQLSSDLARAYEFVMASGATRPTCGFIAELVASTPMEARGLLYDLDANSTLARRGLLTLAPDHAGGLQATPVTVPRTVLRFMCGVLGGLPEALAVYAEHQPTDDAPSCGELVYEPSARAKLIDALRHTVLRKARTRLVLTGARGIGKRSLLRAHLAELGMGIMSIDLEALLAATAPLPILRQLCLEASLRGCAVVLRAHQPPEATSQTTLSGLRLVLDAFPGVVALCTTQAPGPLAELVPDALTIALPELTYSQRALLWRARLQPHTGSSQADKLADQLSEQLRATPSAITRGVQRALASPTWHKHPETRAAQLADAARSLQGHNLAALATPTTTTLTWDDAVLDPKTAERLEELVVHATHKGQVLDAWGMGRKLPYGRGIACLFYGPPGTGKTMTAALIAQRLGLPLFRVELSKITSKYIGETEKNLARLFDEAAQADGILLFDEADSLFSKRTKVQGANDRFANTKVNYLLQRMEAYDGVSILTTNLDKDLDDALRRRLRFRIHFPKPEPELRAKLWSALLPKRAIAPGSIDVDALSEKFDFAGAHIKNAILRAAFRAAHSRCLIDTGLLHDAAVAEARELGMLVRD